MIYIIGSVLIIDVFFMFEDFGIYKYNGKYYYLYCFNFFGIYLIGILF